MGMPKIYKKYNDKYFLDILYHTLSMTDVEEIAVVVFPDCEHNLFDCSNKVKWITNNSPENEMISSIYIAVKKYSNYDGYMILPIDHPKVSSSTIRKLKTEFYYEPQNVILPSYKLKKGHPIIIPKSIANKLKNQDIVGGLNSVIKNSKPNVKIVEVNDPGIVENLNEISEVI